MSEIEGLLRAYDQLLLLPWDNTLAGPQRVWFAVYEPLQERRLRFRLTEFELATRNAKRTWRLLDVSDAFPSWMAQHRYRDTYFAKPELLKPAMRGFVSALTKQITDALTAPDVDRQTMVAVVGIGAIFGLAHASVVFKDVASSIRGRMLVFFPGQYDGGAVYRLLDARDGWNYLAVPITSNSRQ